MANPYGMWNLQFRRNLFVWEENLVAEIQLKLAGFTLDSSCVDCLVWKWSPNQLFSVKYAYATWEQQQHQETQDWDFCMTSIPRKNCNKVTLSKEKYHPHLSRFFLLVLWEENTFGRDSDRTSRSPAFSHEKTNESRPVRIDTLTMTVHVPFNHGMPQANRIILPYAKKEDKGIRRTVSSVQILQGNISPLPPCEYTHNDPAVVFSSGGATGNIFHEFSDIIIPLFITSRHFQSHLRFIVPDFAIRFMSKYKKIFSHLSSYEVINPAANVSVHCFPGAVVGLHYHDNLAIKTMEVPEGYSMLDFKQFLRESYNLKIRDLSEKEKPTLILISRKNKRVFMNEDEMVTMMKALGFRVIIAQPDLTANMDKFAEIVSSCSILVGAHGAGLTNAVFLPEGAVLVQVVGLGIEWISNTAFGIPAPGMGLNYIEYKIEPEESSLISLYGKDHPVIVDPGSITSEGYEILRDVYLVKQNFNIDVARFRKTLVNALGLLGRSAPLLTVPAYDQIHWPVLQPRDWRKMEKVPRGLVFLATPLICLLLLPLLYTVDLRSDVFPSDQGEDQTQIETTGFACHTNLHTQVCVANRPVRIDTHTMNVYAPFSQQKPQANRTIRPYARQEDKTAMSLVSPVHILQGNSSPPACQYTHNVPALVFSSGGFAGNLFHEFSEILIPLFITSRHFQSHLHFIVTDFSPSFFGKFENILSHLSSYKVINPTANGSVHCFPGAVVGLHYHDNLVIKSSDIPGGYSMLNFKQFLRESYNLKTGDLSQVPEQPVLILISRQSSRRFLNENEMVTMMKALGFKVVIARPNGMSNLDKFAQVMSTCSVMVGAHGAGLTNALFLAQGAVLVQLVPLGLDWASTNYFGGPAAEMGLNYIEYKIQPEESTLLSLYGCNHPVITNPASIFAKGYTAARAVYVDRQNMYINVVRFRKTLVKALGLLGRSAPSGRRNRVLR
ncbi:hypothetical protein RHMOL_Rhmol06G0301900 [Rhododendron molle]|uniref:Uncharacterized protein n=1 Tax=Rhododendron molle TaxID=49168 RepID=A0ACC0NIY5_RHOML|nr:hypothetical protein RHMOL_Rhmol06G0301900 [Rhododendron molle]